MIKFLFLFSSLWNSISSFWLCISGSLWSAFAFFEFDSELGAQFVFRTQIWVIKKFLRAANSVFMLSVSSYYFDLSLFLGVKICLEGGDVVSALFFEGVSSVAKIVNGL